MIGLVPLVAAVAGIAAFVVWAVVGNRRDRPAGTAGPVPRRPAEPDRGGLLAGTGPARDGGAGPAGEERGY